MAQEPLLHKTQKTSFLLVFWLTAALNTALFVGLHMAPARDTLREAMSRLTNIGGSAAWIDAVGSIFRYR